MMVKYFGSTFCMIVSARWEGINVITSSVGLMEPSMRIIRFWGSQGNQYLPRTIIETSRFG